MGLREAVKGYSPDLVEQAARLALSLDRPITVPLLRSMLESLRREKELAASLEALPVSDTTESFMRRADYFFRDEQAPEAANG
jgi:hypothetical protein